MIRHEEEKRSEGECLHNRTQHNNSHLSLLMRFQLMRYKSYYKINATTLQLGTYELDNLDTLC